MADIFATPGVHAAKFDQESGGVTPYVKLATPTTAIPTTDSLGGTRTHNTAGGIRQAVGAVSARAALPTLGTSREMYVMATQRCFFLTGTSSATATNTTGLTNMSHPLAADERVYFRVPAGHTHIAYIRESADGFISIIPVA